MNLDTHHRMPHITSRRALAAFLLTSTLFAGAVLAADSSQADGPKAACIHHAGAMVCGYHCVSGEGHARCAQTPEGVCAVSSGIVACWDPPPFLTTVLRNRLPRARCVQANGQVACGFQCLISHDRVQCAQTPFGVCRANAGTVLCWDPPAHVIAEKAYATPQPGCVAAFDKVACGYHCEAKEGSIRCAQTPDGICERLGELSCWDPPPKNTTAFASGATVACFDANGGRSCGYRCIGTARQSGCGSSPKDYCFLSSQDRVVCAAPY